MLQADLSPRPGIGPELRRARESRGLSLDAASRATRIRPRYLGALEDDAGADAFPGPIYARFFLKEYARFLGVDDGPLLTALQERTAPDPPALRLVAELEPPRRWVGHLVRFAAVACLLALLGYSVLAARGGGPSAQVADMRARLTEVPRYDHRTHASVGVPKPDLPIRMIILVREPTHIEVFVNGERVVKRTVWPRRLVIRAFGATGAHVPRAAVEVEINNGSAVKLVVNGRLIPTQNRTPFHARFVSDGGRLARL